jgi:hypothetical protein
LAEAALEEKKIILGWHIDFCCLGISLPDYKFKAWTISIKEILSRGTSTAKELETMIGRLGHLGAIVPFVYHFLSRLRDLQWKATKRRAIAIPKPYQDNLKLMFTFLHKAFTGINMNLISFRRPTHIYRLDSCPYGLGGYSHKGFAWRLELPKELLLLHIQQPPRIYCLHHHALDKGATASLFGGVTISKAAFLNQQKALSLSDKNTWQDVRILIVDKVSL